MGIITNSLKVDIKTYILIICIIIISNETFWFSNWGNPILSLVKTYFSVVLPFVLWFTYKGTYTYKDLSIVFVVSFCLIFASLFNSNPIGVPLFISLIIFVASIFVKKISIEKFAEIFCGIMLFIMIYSLIIWLGATFNLFSLDVYENTNESIYYSKFLSLVLRTNHEFLFRNCSFFYEPGMFMIFINISFIFEVLLLKRKLNLFKLILYMLVIYSTFSTAGYFTFGIIYLVSLINSKKTIGNFFVPFIIFSIGLFLILNSESIVDQLFSKLDSSSMEEQGSGLARISSIVVPFYILLDFPFWGPGSTILEDVYVEYSRLIYGIPIDSMGMMTNTIMILALLFGPWLVFLILYSLYSFIQIMKMNKLCTFIIFVVFLMMLFNESIFQSLLFYILLFYGIKHKMNSHFNI